MKLIPLLSAVIATTQFCAGEAEWTYAISYLQPNREPAKGYEKHNVSGLVQMAQKVSGGMTSMHVTATGLKPNTPHGFHVHEEGDIFSKGCQSTGSHYNPFHKTHGAPTDSNRHVGDLGNVMSDADGKVEVQIEDRLVSLVGPYSVYGRAFVLHALRDDLGRGTGVKRAGSLKTGNAGARLACGVIIHAPVENYFSSAIDDEIEAVQNF